MPTPSAPPPDAVERFRGTVARLIGDVERIGVAVSGGSDSMALLRLSHAAFPGRVFAAAVDHGLRAEARMEALFVADVCAGLGIPHATLGPAPLEPGNVPQAARRLRYRLLGEWCAANALPIVAVAHQRDDVAETLLMRAARGSGLAGLARMAEVAPLPHGDGSARLVRPLLDWSRAELATIALDAVHDPSNDDLRYDRVRIRQLLIREPSLNPEGLARAAANLAEAEAALAWAATAAWRSRATCRHDSIAVDMDDLPRELRRRLAQRAMHALDPLWSGEGLDGLVDLLEKDRPATLGNVAMARDRDGRWQFTIAPPRSAIR